MGITQASGRPGVTADELGRAIEVTQGVLRDADFACELSVSVKADEEDPALSPLTLIEVALRTPLPPAEVLDLLDIIDERLAAEQLGHPDIPLLVDVVAR